MGKHIGILTSGGDSPGLNAAIRAIGKAGIEQHDMRVLGFRDGFRGLVENRTVRLGRDALSGILTTGGTLLGTSRDKPHKMPMGGDRHLDMTPVIIETYQRHHLDALVCLGGGGTQKNAYRLHKAGLNIITLPKTIDFDVWGSDATIGFDTALGIATEAVDRLHSTAHSHHRIIVVEIMGHNTGWLALGAGLAGGADVILVPEIGYDAQLVANAIQARVGRGSHFSIVAVSEGAMPADIHARWHRANEKRASPEKELRAEGKAEIATASAERRGHTMRLSARLEALTGLESRVTILGHVQRGGAPSAADRVLATRLGAAAARFAEEGRFGVMAAARGDRVEPVPLDDVVGRRKVVPLDHDWLATARALGICLGDR